MAHRNSIVLFVWSAVLGCGLANSALSQEKPWSEKVLKSHTSFADISTRLTSEQLQKLRDKGETLFAGKFTTSDGFGRPLATQAIIPTKRRHAARSVVQRLPGPDANACSSCHNDPVTGGAGHVTANVFVSEGFSNADFDTTDPQFSNERNTNHLMGAGLIELLAREMTRDLTELRRDALRSARNTKKPVTVELKSKGVHFGKLLARPDGTVDLSEIEGVDSDLQIRPFSHKGVFTSIRQFTINAMNHHHGMQASERFGKRWTGEDDFDGDSVTDELSKGDISALVAWQATLPSPAKRSPGNQGWAMAAKRGEALFGEIGCVSCHKPTLPLESSIFSDPGPYDAAGTLRASEVENAVEYDFSEFKWFQELPRNEKGQVLVPLFGDLKRHQISDATIQVYGNELLAQRFVERDQFQTTELWGVASTAPYGHRGNLNSIDEAIRGHGGAASASANRYRDLTVQDQESIIAFLKTLVIPNE